ncbi:two-component system response regulator YesN [Anoxybacillus tepidamans]|uniref:Two-component system response regulator YesN n=1 Tax=Anoxybacteroides tepidamans TaxID=265948 RepID=A0A7W8MY64_9BACL|nr:response regulator [Anoxybacillus tepidamans]MBB5326355.1 two-component system response regulator YesN [Anoxybacillus tepidamans]
MHRVMLVDDEVFVREGLRALIDWEAYGYRICGEADNGEDALWAIERLQPDLVVTDIRMPVLDGLELIRHMAVNRQAATKFIVISGYSDFSYAQQSIKYGVCDFILKPIDKKEFEQALERIANLLNEEKKQIEMRKEQVIEMLFRRLIRGEIDDETANEQMRELGIPFYPLFGYVMIEINQGDKEMEQIEHQEMKRQIDDVFRNHIHQPIYFPTYEHGWDRYGLLLIAENETEMNGNIDSLYKQLTNLRLNMTMYVSGVASCVGQLQQLLEQVYYAMRYKYMVEEGPIFYDQVKGVDVHYMDIDDQLYDRLIEYIEESQLDHILHTVSLIFYEFRAKRFAAEAVKTSIVHFVQKAVGIVKHLGGREEQLTTLSRVMECQRYSFSLNEIQQRFIDFAIECSKIIDKLRGQLMICEIHKVKKYIEEHYHENISLKNIAHQFYMNPVYLGQLFRKTYGVYFKKFLLQLRIQQAKKLLRTTDLRVYEIAEQVGFGSVDYFVTQFEKMEGLTPTEYRKQTIRLQL